MITHPTHSTFKWDALLEKLSQIHGPNLKALFRYGTHHDHLLCIFDQLSFQTLSLQQGVCVSFKPPLPPIRCFTLSEIQTSLDVFPIEFLHIQETKQLVFGTDCLADLTVDLTHLRHECEFYLRSNVLKLRADFCTPNVKATQLIQESFPSFVRVLQSLHALSKAPMPLSIEAMIEASALQFNVDLSAFKTVASAAKLPDTPSFFGTYLACAEALAFRIDHEA